MVGRTAIQIPPVFASYTDFLTFRWTAWGTVTKFRTPTCHYPTRTSLPFSLSWDLTCFRKTSKFEKKPLYSLGQVVGHIWQENLGVLCTSASDAFTKHVLLRGIQSNACRSIICRKKLSTFWYLSNISFHFYISVLFLHKLYKKNKSSTSPEQILFLVTYDTLQLSLVTRCLAVLLCKCREHC